MQHMAYTHLFQCLLCEVREDSVLRVEVLMITIQAFLRSACPCQTFDGLFSCEK